MLYSASSLAGHSPGLKVSIVTARKRKGQRNGLCPILKAVTSLSLVLQCRLR